MAYDRPGRADFVSLEHGKEFADDEPGSINMIFPPGLTVAVERTPRQFLVKGEYAVARLLPVSAT